MQVEGIIKGSQISKHVYEFSKDITPEDFLKILRYLGNKSKELGYSYDNNLFFYTKSDAITWEEFDHIFTRLNKDTSYLLDTFTRDDLINRISNAIKILSSTTKAEIVRKVINNKNLLFRYFKKNYIEKYCSRWRDFKQYKIVLPAVSDQTMMLIFSASNRRTPLASKGFLQYWRLGNSYSNTELSRDYATEIVGDHLTVNLKDCDNVIIRSLRSFLDQYDSGKELTLHCETKAITADDLGVEKLTGMTYSLGIFDLAGYFGLRKGSRFKTFSEGVRHRADQETIAQYLGRKFIITAENCNVYSGKAHPKDLFEQIAWHLRIEYIQEKTLLCTVIADETQETITAVWDIMDKNHETASFCFIEL